MNDDAGRLSNQVAQVVDLVKRDVADDYESVVAWQKSLQDAVRELVIMRVEPAFNQKLESMPRETIQEKRELCRWANHELRNTLGLAIRCPKTGRPAMLHVSPGRHPANGQFGIQLLGNDLNHRRTKTSSSLLWLPLGPEKKRNEALIGYWTSKLAGPEKTNRSHEPG